MINLRRCFACQLHCNYIESGLQVHEVFLTEIIVIYHSQFLNNFAVIYKDGLSTFLFLCIFTS